MVSVARIAASQAIMLAIAAIIVLVASTLVAQLVMGAREIVAESQGVSRR
jgi:hypothetical protein